MGSGLAGDVQPCGDLRVAEAGCRGASSTSCSRAVSVPTPLAPIRGTTPRVRRNAAGSVGLDASAKRLERRQRAATVLDRRVRIVGTDRRGRGRPSCTPPRRGDRARDHSVKAASSSTLAERRRPSASATRPRAAPAAAGNSVRSAESTSTSAESRRVAFAAAGRSPAASRESTSSSSPAAAPIRCFLQLRCASLEHDLGAGRRRRARAGARLARVRQSGVGALSSRADSMASASSSRP